MIKYENYIVGRGSVSEREVSKLSSASIYEALISLGHDVILIDPAYGADQPENTELFFSKEDHAEVSARNYVTAVDSKKIDEADLVFIGLHGKYGEDGAIQSLLDLAGSKIHRFGSYFQRGGNG